MTKGKGTITEFRRGRLTLDVLGLLLLAPTQRRCKDAGTGCVLIGLQVHLKMPMGESEFSGEAEAMAEGQRLMRKRFG